MANIKDKIAGNKAIAKSKRAIRGNSKEMIKNVKSKSKRPPTKMEIARANEKVRTINNTTKSPGTMSSKEAVDFKRNKVKTDIKKIKLTKKNSLESLKKRADYVSNNKKIQRLKAKGIKVLPKSSKASVKENQKIEKDANKKSQKYRKKNAGDGFCATSTCGSVSRTSSGSKKSAMKKKKVAKVRFI
tara:strand:- start:860 stop:1420 length:561 start_codon:yes stop_codon:yes gene_type:complete